MGRDEPAQIEWSFLDGGSDTWWDGTTYNYPDEIEIEIDGAGGCQLDVEEELYGGQLTLHIVD